LGAKALTANDPEGLLDCCVVCCTSLGVTDTTIEEFPIISVGYVAPRRAAMLASSWFITH